MILSTIKFALAGAAILGGAAAFGFAFLLEFLLEFLFIFGA